MPVFRAGPLFPAVQYRSGEANYLDNSAAASQGGAGIRAAQVIADHGARALITPRCGENVQKALSGAEVLIYKALPGTVRRT
jgi:predicted Fe-Mo cluster-binding NifX family protein